MGRLHLTASETYEEIVELGRKVFVPAGQRPFKSKPFFRIDTLKSAAAAILEQHGYPADMIMVDEQPPSKICHV
jgi:hypothetical protein